MKDLEKAKQLLKAENYTCVFCKDDTVYSSVERGVKPLVEMYQSKKLAKGFSAADKVVGKGAAFLYLLLEIKSLYAAVISRSALELLNKNGISVEYDTKVQNITNRKGDGICPFEEAVLTVDDKTAAYEIIVDKIKRC